jgi:hypothetical protein
MSRTANDRARTILTDATIIATLINAALANLDLGLAGWPEQTPGASPTQAQGAIECSHPDCNESLPCDLHSGGLPYDKASHDLEQLLEAIRQTAHHTRLAAAIVTRWGYAGLNEATVTQRLLTIDATIWCAHCSQFGRHEPRAKDQTECEWCATFRVRYKRPPPKIIWDARDARNGRLDETTITRLLKQVDTDRKAAQAANKARQRADAKVS